MATILSRRRFLGSTALAGIASMLPALGAPAAEPSLETTTIKLPRAPAICTMPQMIPQQLLQAEGFTDIRFIDETGNVTEQLARGDVDLMVNASIREKRPRCWPACMSAASCCSATKTSTASLVSRGRPSACQGSGRARICCCP